MSPSMRKWIPFGYCCLILNACEFFPPTITNGTNRSIRVVYDTNGRTHAPVTIAPGSGIVQRVQTGNLTRIRVVFDDGHQFELNRKELDAIRQQSGSKSEKWLVEDKHLALLNE
jgi:hypothetical protein